VSSTNRAGPAGPVVPLARPRLQERLGHAFERRLTTVIAEAGFGKSTLLAEWARELRSAWYTLEPDDAALDSLVQGLADSLRLRVPAMNLDLAGGAGAWRGPDATDELARAEGYAALLCEELEHGLERELVLVLDDVSELPANGPSVRLIEAICRHAPGALHLVLSSREEVPFSIERLRGRGEVLELTGAELAFTAEEVAELVRGSIGEQAGELGRELHEATGGWPAAIRLALEALMSVSEEDRAAAFERMQRPGGALFTYLAHEVLARESPEVRELVRTVAHLERFTTELCETLGLDDAADAVASLARRGLFIEPRGAHVGWFSLNQLVRRFVVESLPLGEERLAEIRAAAADWFEQRGLPEESLRLLGAADDLEGIARILQTRGSSLLASGSVEAVISAVERLPDDLCTAEIEQLAGEALQVRGDWEGALRRFSRAAGDMEPLDPGHAWRMGLIHHLRGELDDALAVYERGAEDAGVPRDRALLLAWRSACYWLRSDVEACRRDAERAYEIATEAADPPALATAHTVLAMLAALEGDRRANDAHYLRALEYAERAGDVLQIIRVRTNRGSRHLEEGAYEEALAELEIALRHADVAGFASFQALALSNRGEALYRLGRLEEAVADLEAARDVYQRLDSRMIAYPLAKLGTVYRERGDLALARTAYEEAVAAAEAAQDRQGLIPGLSGLARTLATDEPEEAAALATRAVELGPGMSAVDALLAMGWVALARSDHAQARDCAEQASAEARRRRDRAGLAESLELAALSSPEPTAEVERLEEAASIWHDLRSPLGEARARLAGAVISGDGERRSESERFLRRIGVRSLPGIVAGKGDRPTEREPRPLMIQTLGRFRVQRGDELVPHTAWQSKKARDLLKMLVARRGRRTARDVVMEALWPGDDPARVGKRLSVALSTLRGVLDPTKRFDPEYFVSADPSAIAIELEHVDVDVERFVTEASAGLAERREGRSEAALRLAAAEAAYAGDFLEEDAYSDWAVSLREEARALYIEVLRALADDASANADQDAATRYLLRVLERDPYDEPAHLELVRVLVAAGRHGEARRHFRTYRVRMQEIGVESAPFPRARPLAAA
jgi:ATP/maltotriose-dependent transcriptional regulator MalT/DNA-binding SARP family transcriptional activator